MYFFMHVNNVSTAVFSNAELDVSICWNVAQSRSTRSNPIGINLGCWKRQTFLLRNMHILLKSQLYTLLFIYLDILLKDIWPSEIATTICVNLTESSFMMFLTFFQYKANIVREPAIVSSMIFHVNGEICFFRKKNEASFLKLHCEWQQVILYDLYNMCAQDDCSMLIHKIAANFRSRSQSGTYFCTIEVFPFFSFSVFSS